MKKVRYWAAQRAAGEFTPNAEVDELKWLPVAEAMKQLEYPDDRKVLRRFAEQPVDTQAVLIVRHGTAGSKSRYKGDDRKRPLDKRGRAQAESLVGVLLAFGAKWSTQATECDAIRRSSHWPRNLPTIHNEPLLTEEATPRTTRPPSTAERGRRHARDLHTGQGDTISRAWW
jgi:8-oxo-dGTP diphosphatase